MTLFIIIIVGSIILVVLGILFYLLSKEGQKIEDDKAVPLTDLSQLKSEFSAPSIEPQQIIPRPLPEDDIYKKRIQELEDELRSTKQRAEEQADATREMVITLSKENQSLKSRQADSEESSQKLTELEGEISKLKTENTDLQTQLGSVNAKVKLLEEEKTTLKTQMEEDVSKANAKVPLLEEEISRANAALAEASKSQSDDALRRELESLKSEQTQLKQLNAQLTEKNEQLQYEMIKARAQSSGLARVSFNYKNQLEDFFMKINAVQVTNENLSQAKNRLEGMVEEVKLQNEELVKKDHLAQFELEKNRSRLLVLERDYEDLKARVQQNNQQ